MFFLRLLLVAALFFMAVTAWRGNNSPASTLLPTGDYTGELEELYRMDGVFREIDNLAQRESFARALLLVCPLKVGEKTKLNFRDYELAEPVRKQLTGLMGVKVERDPDSSEENGNRWVFTKDQDTYCKSIELLLQEISRGSTKGQNNGLYGSPIPTTPRVSNAGEEDSDSAVDVGAMEERTLVKRAFDDIQQGKLSRSMMTRAQRVFSVYKRDYQRFPMMKVRLFRDYNTRERIGADCEVSALCTLGQALRDVDKQAWQGIQEGSHALYCLRNARLAALDPACTFLQADLRPPGVNLYLLEAVHEDDESG